MFKKILLLTAMTGLVTACGGGSGGSGSSSGGSGDGSNGGGKNPNQQLTINTTKMAYLSVLQGERTDSSQFEQQDLSAVSNNKLTIKPTNSSKKISVLAQCEGSNQERQLYAFDLVVTAARTLPLDCGRLSAPADNKHNLELIDSSSGSFERISRVIGGMDVYRGSTWTNGHYYIPLNTRANKRTVWALSYNTNQGGFQLYVDNNEQFTGGEATTKPPRSYNPNQASPLLETVSPPLSYDLTFYSPSRFTQGLLMNRSNMQAWGAALIDTDDVLDSDYYIEKYLASNGSENVTYEHMTREPKGSELFGSEGTYNGGSGSLATYSMIDRDLSVDDNLELEGDLKFRAVTAQIVYQQGETSWFYLDHYSEGNFTAFADLSAATTGHELSNKLNEQAEYPYSYVVKANAIYDNGVEGVGRISATTDVKSAN